ncbi:MAG: hypothetical protein HON70_33220, partial [Lentisphaerae bacterium]|nr:hypothetical protein [Lentisphaerota bacterium]
MKRSIFGTLKRVVRSTRGDSMLQTTASIAAATIVAGATVPAVSSYMTRAKESRASSEVKSTATMIHALMADLGKGNIPRASDDSRALALMATPGIVPPTEAGDGNFWTAPLTDPAVGDLNAYLYTNAVGFKEKASPLHGRGWCGPYLDSILESDPWGNRYMVSIGLFGRRNTAVAIVVSAGADGVLSV